MEKKRTVKTYFEDKLYDHPVVKEGLRDGWAFIIMAVSAFIFALGYKCFLVPRHLLSLSDATSGKPVTLRLISGGVSGIAQLIIMIISLFPNDPFVANPSLEDTIFSILYFVINIPIFVLAWKGIGKRFTVFTFLNVILVTAFTDLLALWDDGWVNSVAEFAQNNGGLLSRAIFAGVCVGLSSGLAFKMDASGGGIDVISYYIALRKSVLVGKYNVLINAVTMALFTLLGSLKIWTGSLPETSYITGMDYFNILIFAIIYLLAAGLVIDMINLRNKKMKIEVVCSNPDLPKIIISTLPHGATVIPAKGAFTGKDRTIIEIVVSSYELKHAIKVIRECDPSAFVQVSELKQVYGRFYIPPVR